MSNLIVLGKKKTFVICYLLLKYTVINCLHSRRAIEEVKEAAAKDIRAANAEKERLDGELKEISRVKSTLLQENTEVKQAKQKVDEEIEALKNRLKDVEANLAKQADKVDT